MIGGDRGDRPLRPDDPRKGVWPTPAWLFAPLHRRLGFDLDVAASADNAKCRRFFSVQTSALERAWDARCWWCNPPYGCQPGTAVWVAHARRQVELFGNRGVLLVPIKAETGWWQELVRGRNRVTASARVTTGPLKGCWYRLREPRFDVEILELRRRVSFAGGTGWFASALICYGAPTDGTSALRFDGRGRRGPASQCVRVLAKPGHSTAELVAAGVSVAEACRRTGVSRQAWYRYALRFDEGAP